MNYLSVCAVLKNEGLYLKEWVEFYLKQGVERFYLYDNESSDNPKEVLKEYADKITWHRTKGTKQQRVAYNHMIREYTKDNEWCAFVDIDEFFYSGKDKSFIETIRRDYDQVGVVGVAISWLLFGSSGHLEYSDEPVTRRFTHRAEEVNQHIKSVMRLKDTYSTGNNVHTFRAHGHIVNERFNYMPLEYAILDHPSAEILRINHYVTKSKAECEIKVNRGRADTGGKDGEDFFVNHDRNDVEDKRILEVL